MKILKQVLDSLITYFTKSHVTPVPTVTRAARKPKAKK